MKFKLYDLVEYRGLRGRIYKITDEEVAVEFLNVKKCLDYPHAYLEFNLEGKNYDWQIEPSIVKIREN